MPHGIWCNEIFVVCYEKKGNHFQNTAVIFTAIIDFFSKCTHKLFAHPREDVKWLQSESDVLPVTVHITAWFNIIPRQKVIEAAVKYGVCWWRRRWWWWDWQIKLVSIVTYETTNDQSGNLGKRHLRNALSSRLVTPARTQMERLCGQGQMEVEELSLSGLCSEME